MSEMLSTQTQVAIWFIILMPETHGSFNTKMLTRFAKTMTLEEVAKKLSCWKRAHYTDGFSELTALDTCQLSRPY